MPILTNRLYELIKGSKTNQYIETRSYKGEGIKKVLKHYERIHSIEFSDKWYQYNLDKFLNHPQVEIHFGDSAKILPDLLSKINEPVTIYLDAHYFGGSSTFGDEESPLLFELEFFKSRPYDDIIIIDDYRLLGDKRTCGINHNRSVYPTMNLDCRSITDESILNLVKPGYEIFDNQNNEFSSGSPYQIILAKAEKTLVVLLGNARGGEETWATMYKNLLEHYKADLALCFGEKEDKSASLYIRAKYIWELPEFCNWREYYDRNFKNNWDFFFSQHSKRGTMGGIDSNVGSGAIIFAFRDFMLKTKIDILKLYDRIILTRSDFYYIDKHPILGLGKLYAVEGEEYGGVSDRHFIFDSEMAQDVLGICDFLCDENNFNFFSTFSRDSINAEKALLMFFKHTKINEKLVPCRRVQFTVSVDGDSTRWKLPKHHIPGNKKIRHKYYAEFAVALKNLIIKKGFFSSLSDAFIWKAKINSILMRILMKINRVKFFLLIKKLNTKN